jgi:hypothetical protein
MAVTKAKASGLVPENSAPATVARKIAEFAESDDPATSRALADLAVRPSASAAVVMSVYAKTLGIREVDIGALAVALEEDIEAMQAGDMKRAEAMLYAQANALQAIFMRLSFRSTKQETIQHCEAYLRMALKAQNQCRMTLETLSTIKNPPVVFARQANVQQNVNNGGQQQVNNGGMPAGEAAPARASDSETTPTELLEKSDGQRLDTGTQGAAGGADPQLAAVGKVNRATNRRGQGARGAEPLPRGATAKAA